MKSKLILIFLFLVLSIGLVSSVEITIKDELKKGENFVVRVSGEFIRPLLKENIEFYRRHLSTSMGQFDLKYLEGDYYFYLNVPQEKIPDNYSVVLKDIEYRLAGRTIKGDVSAEFRILEESVPFSVSPSVIISSDTYQLQFQNLMSTSIVLDLDKMIKTSSQISSGDTIESGGFLDSLFDLFSSNEPVLPEDKETIVGEITLSPGQTRSVTYPAPTEKGFESLSFTYEENSYAILVYNPVGVSEPSSDVQVNDSISDSTETPEENPVDTTQETPEENLTNVGGEDIPEEPNISISEDSSQNNTVVAEEDENKTSFWEGIFGKKEDKEEDTSETLQDKAEEEVPEPVDTLTEEQREALPACQSLKGVVCAVGKEKCEGDSTESKSGKCCLGECVPLEKNSTGKIVGWGILLVLSLFIAWFFKSKYRNAGPGKINLANIARGRRFR